MNSFNYKLKAAKNRALVCYCATNDGDGVKESVKSVFQSQNIEIGEFIDGGGGETLYTITNVVGLHFDQPQTVLNIALKWGETSRRLRVGGSFSDVCVGVFFYDQPAPPPAPEPDPDADPDEEPEPAPSITSLVCDALRETFGGVFGASVFAVPSDITSYTLGVE